MSQNSSDSADVVESDRKRIIKLRVILALAFPLWVYLSFLTAQIITIGLLRAVEYMNVPVQSLNENIFSSVVSVFIYAVTVCITIGLPWIIKRKKISLADIGLQRLPSFGDMGIAPAGLIVYFVFSSLLIFTASAIFPWFDAGQAQDTGFSLLSTRYEYILAFVTLVIIAPFAEEILFRGYLYGQLRKTVPVWVAVLIASLLFGAIHGAWNLAFDTFALSIVLCVLRETTGSLWASVLLHMIKNGIAFYILFINPLLFNTLGA